MNNLHPDLKFIFENLSHSVNFLDININIKNNQLLFDIYYKPTNSFSYLKYSSCHPKHTKDNISLSLAKRIIQIVSEDPNKRLLELKEHLITCGHSKNIINYNFTKIFSPSNKPHKENTNIPFITTHNPNNKFNKNKFINCMKNIQHPNMKSAFKEKNILMTTRQPPNLRKKLVRAKFELNPTPKTPKIVGLFPCKGCKYHKNGYIKPCTQFKFWNGKKEVYWKYRRYFTCDSKNIIYILICNNCNKFYIGQTQCLKQRTSKHISDIKLPHNSTCRYCSEHLSTCSTNTPQFSIYPIFYEDHTQKRRYKESRFILQFKPLLNGYS